MQKRHLLRTLRFRLTVWNTLVVLVTVLLALFAVREGMRLTIERETMDLLRDEAVELELAISQLHPDLESISEEFARKVVGHSQHDWFAGLLGSDGLFLWKSSNFPEDDWDLSDDPSGQRAPDRNAPWLLVERTVKTPGGDALRVIVGEPSLYIRNDVWQLTKIMFYIGTAMLLIAPVGGYLLARRVTAPVREIISTTRSLQPSNLNSRLPIRGTGDELDQISQEINSFVDQISRYINSQREFVANAAHELRSPLTAIQTSVEVTLEKERSQAEYLEELETVSEQCEQLRHLVNQLLELAESDNADQFRSFNAVDLGSLVEKSVNVFSGVADERGITIRIRLDANANVPGDESKLRQVVNNLLDNALKFSPSGGKVEIVVTHQSTGVTLLITDSGPGVPDRFLERIFDRFYQVDPARQRDHTRGNGLGLSICKSIVERHGGHIRAENTGAGLRLVVHFPVG